MLKVIQFALMSFVLAFTNFAVAEEGAPDSIPGTTLVTAEDVINLVEDKDDLVIIDARKASDRSGAGWVPDSIGLPDYDTTPASLAKVIPSKSTPVVFYCNGVKCGRSVKSSKLAVKEGYTNVYWFRGGWDAWDKAGYPVEK